MVTIINLIARGQPPGTEVRGVLMLVPEYDDGRLTILTVPMMGEDPP